MNERGPAEPPPPASMPVVDRSALRRLCRSNAIQRLALFGSVLHGTAHSGSDVDLLVEFDPDSIPGLFRIVEIERELSGLFGRPVDLRTAQDLSRYFRNQVLAEARPIYEAD